MMFDAFRARVGVILINNGQILLIRDIRQKPPTFHLPGDIVKLNETLDAAAKRAVKEQAGLDIDVQKLLYVRDDIGDGRHRLDAFFLGAISRQQELAPQENQNFKVDWINLEILESMDLFPQFLRSKILEDHQNKFRDGAKYVGALE